MAHSPKVTVVIPVYNRERYVRDAITSILDQHFTDFELLVIDDGSTDRTHEVVQSFDDPRLRLVCNEHNQGIARTRNEGVRLARGEYLAFLDSDDWSRPERLGRQVTFLDRHPDHAGVGGWIRWMDSEGRLLPQVKRKATSPKQIAAKRLFQSGLLNNTSMARTEVLRTYKHNEEYLLGSDFEMWARIAADHQLANLPEVLVHMRQHPERTSALLGNHKQTFRSKTYARQLAALGVDFDAVDLERHFLLRRIHKVGFAPDQSYVEWADGWLRRLQDANQSAKLYPEPAFTEVLGGYWRKVCWHASHTSGWWAYRRFFSSPLRTPACREFVRRKLGKYVGPMKWMDAKSEGRRS